MLSSTSDGRWRVAGISFTDSLMYERRGQIAVSIVLSALCCVTIAGMALLIYLKSVNKPVRRLMCAMHDFEKDAANFSYTGGSIAVSEIAELSDSFGHMVGRIQRLMTTVREEEVVLRKTELKALQAQINPHFLYNTLDTIIWLVETGKNEQAVEMVTSLSNFFRSSLSQGRDIITLGEEEIHVRSYLEIQQVRYRDILRYEIHVQPELRGCMLPKLTLQPLVENALYHGIKLRRGLGCILVDAAQEDDRVCITVRDDGAGMPPERLQQLRQSLDTEEPVGFGLRTVYRRLRLLYGEQCSMELESEPGAGTTVTLRFPIRKEAGA